MPVRIIVSWLKEKNPRVFNFAKNEVNVISQEQNLANSGQIYTPLCLLSFSCLKEPLQAAVWVHQE